jgi:hypothetical protein
MQSASAIAPWADITQTESMLRGLRLAELMKCPHDARNIRPTIDCLMKADPQTLVDTEFMGITHGFTGSIGIFVPIIDGSFLDESPETAMRLGNFKKCNILLGSNSEEGNYFVLYYFPDMFPRVEDITVNRQNFTQTIIAAYPNLNKIQRAALQYEYTNWIDPDDTDWNRDAVDKYTGDHQFTCPVVDWAHRYAETGNNVYMYHFQQQATITQEYFADVVSARFNRQPAPFPVGRPNDLSHLTGMIWANDDIRITWGFVELPGHGYAPTLVIGIVFCDVTARIGRGFRCRHRLGQNPRGARRGQCRRRGQKTPSAPYLKALLIVFQLTH